MAYPAGPADADYHIEDGIRRRYVAAEEAWVIDQPGVDDAANLNASAAGVQLVDFAWPKVANAAALPVLTNDHVGTIYTTADDGRNHQLVSSDGVTAVWNIWETSGVNTPEDITGAYVLDVAGHVGAAAELTLTGDASLSFTGWAANTSDLQEILVTVKQDATGGHVFDWRQTQGDWTEVLSPSLPTLPGDTAVEFWARTTDGGATVTLEPIGVKYELGCLVTETIETDVPAVTANGTVDIGHSFSIVGSVELINQATGRREAADWWQQGAVASADVNIDFTDAVNAGDLKARIVGQQSSVCDLSVSVNRWETLTITATAATTLTPTIGWVGANDDVQIDWGDGTVTNPINGVASPYTYGAAYTGPIYLRWRPSVSLTSMTLGTSSTWGITSATEHLPQSLTLLILRSTSSAISGSADRLPGGLATLDLTGATGSAITGSPSGLPSNLVSLYLTSTASSIMGQFSDLPQGLQNLYLNNTASNLAGAAADLPSTLAAIVATNSTFSLAGAAADLPSTLTNLQINSATATMSGAASSLPVGMTVLSVANTGVNISGLSSELPPAMTILIVTNSPTSIGGGFSGLPATLWFLNASGSAVALTGTTGDLSAAVRQLSLTSTPSVITGPTADLPAALEVFHLEATASAITRTTAWAAPSLNNILNLAVSAGGTGMTAAEVNGTLVDLVAANVTPASSRTINLSGVNAAPDATSGGFDGLAAITTLQGRSWIVVTN